MSRHPSNPNPRGSLRWTQVAVNRPALLNAKLTAAFPKMTWSRVDWKSPLAGDDYAEYRDADFLKVLGLPSPPTPLSAFWPRFGPQWDALGVGQPGNVRILVEAKANIPEFVSDPCGASAPNSVAMIQQAIARTKAHMAPKSKKLAAANWMGPFYQIANRLAHLYYLREVLGEAAVLAFVYFVNAPDMKGPQARDQWEAAIAVAHEILGMPQRHALSQYVADIFIDTRDL